MRYAPSSIGDQTLEGWLWARFRRIARFRSMLPPGWVISR